MMNKSDAVKFLKNIDVVLPDGSYVSGSISARSDINPTETVHIRFGQPTAAFEAGVRKGQKAAELHRLSQARNLIKTVKIEKGVK